MIIRSVSLTFSLLLAVASLNAVPVTQNGSAPSLDRPCTFATADEMSALLGTRVTTATDEHFRCKYVVEKGWLETKLLDISLKTTRDIYDYDKAHGKAVPGPLSHSTLAPFPFPFCLFPFSFPCRVLTVDSD